MQRLRVTYRRGEPLKFLSHLDLHRLWFRAFRRAGVPLAYSEGFSAHPRFSIAAALPVSVTGEAELMDVYLTRRLAPFFFMRAVNRVLPPGSEIVHAEEVDLGLPALQALMRAAEYRVTVETDRSKDEIEEAARRLLAQASLPWEHKREDQVRRYDLRALIEDIRVEDVGAGRAVLVMRLKADMSGAGRAEQVTAALGFSAPPLNVHRTRLVLAPPIEVMARQRAAPASAPSGGRTPGPDEALDEGPGKRAER
ncbi:MAG: DUF2344 domain-containing protein [Chloroflexi bacterium]|nr:DUF2344 domain-containing protein [Chloroflexota bacterium]